MKTLIVSGGNVDILFLKELLKEKYDCIIAVDKGIEALHELNIKPSYIVGDFDSVNKDIVNIYRNENIQIQQHNPEKDYTDKEYAWLDENASSNKVIGIGEIGYDLHWDTTTLEEQEQAFIKQIKIALKHNLPVSIHTRDAIQKTYETLQKYGMQKLKGVIHSYSGSSEMAKEFIKLGFKLGISGPITFLNNRTMKEAVESVSLNDLITETDSPYLTPHPYRGKENGHKYIPLIVEKIAEIKDTNIEEVSKIIRENVKELFNI